jgi:hypothetical protein
MSGVWTAVGASTLLSASQGAANRKAQQDANQQNAANAAAQTEFSPWTKAGPGQFTAAPVTESALGGGVKGALSGAMFANTLGKGQTTTGEDPAALKKKMDELEFYKNLTGSHP